MSKPNTCLASGPDGVYGPVYLAGTMDRWLAKRVLPVVEAYRGLMLLKHDDPDCLCAAEEAAALIAELEAPQGRKG